MHCICTLISAGSNVENLFFKNLGITASLDSYTI